MNREFLFGVLNAKLTELLTDNEYQMLKNLSRGQFLEYLFNANVVPNKLSDFETASFEVLDALEKEVFEYVGPDHWIYRYFFAKADNLVEHYNKVYESLLKNEELIENAVFISKFHLIKNISLMYRFNDQNISVEKLQANLLLQKEISDEFLLKAYDLGKQEISVLVKDLVELTVEKADSVLEIEKLLDDYFHEIVSAYAYSSEVEHVLIYYIYRIMKQLENIRAIYYLGGY
ncbi:MAG: hypothetical protein WC964_04115 [Acholeplasmataceae bacterium]